MDLIWVELEILKDLTDFTVLEMDTSDHLPILVRMKSNRKMEEEEASGRKEVEQPI